MSVRKILVGTDFSRDAQAAIGFAYALAEQLGAELLVVHVREASALRAAVHEGLLAESSTDESVAEAVDELTKARLSESLAGYRGGAVPTREIVVSGSPEAEMAECARAEEADLVVVGMAGRSATEALRTALAGSVARGVLRLSPCPVLVVAHDEAPGRAGPRRAPSGRTEER